MFMIQNKKSIYSITIPEATWLKGIFTKIPISLQFSCLKFYEVVGSEGVGVLKKWISFFGLGFDCKKKNIINTL